MKSDRPGLARCGPRVEEFDARERALLAELDATRRAKAAAVEEASGDDPCRAERCMVHAAFKRVVEVLDSLGWRRTRTAAHFRVSPTLLHEWVNTGDQQRKQLPLRVVPRMALLPEPAWLVWKSFEDTWHFGAERTGTDG